MVKLGWLLGTILMQVWEKERQRQNNPPKGEIIEKIKQKFGDVDPLSFPISVESLGEAIAFEILRYADFSNPTEPLSSALRRVNEKSFRNALKTLLKRGLLMWSEPVPGAGGVKLTEDGRKIAQLLWLRKNERKLVEQAIEELKEKGYRFVTSEQLVNQMLEFAKAHDVDEKVFREYWGKRRVGLLMKKLGIRQKRFHYLWVPKNLRLLSSREPKKFLWQIQKGIRNL